MQVAANGNVSWFITPENVGVFIIDSMDEFSVDEEFDSELLALEKALEGALNDFKDSDGMILDIRNNQGGDDAASQLIAKYFLDSERHLYSKQARLGTQRTELEEYHLQPIQTYSYLHPIVILTSRNTASAAELLVLMMRNLANVTLMGEPTQGALSDMLDKFLPNGITFSLSNEYYLSPAQEWFEDTGIPVDITVDYATKEQRQLKVDQGLETAIRLIADN